jgi:hypothetical protein
MFGRRNPLPVHHRVLSFVWPKAGWSRASRYIVHRVRRLPGTPYRIAAGLASGAAVSFTPFIGLHFFFAALFALLLRGSVVASAIGTAVGNPWTFAIIWPSIYGLGNWILGESPGSAHPSNPDFISLFSGLIRALLEFDLVYLIDHVWPVLWPMMIGGIPTAIVVWIGTFWLVRGAVAEYQHVRHRRRRTLVRARTARREAIMRTERIRAAAAGGQEQEEE